MVDDEVQSQHIRCHVLQPEDNLQELVSTFKKALAKAVVLVNTQDNYTLAPEFTSGMEKSTFPVVVVTKSDGTSLVKLLESHEGQTDILARLDTEGMAVEVQQQTDEEKLSTDPGAIGQGKRDGKKSDSQGTEANSVLMQQS